MTTEELEALLQGREETPSLEFKAACVWDAARMARDFLAMSNGEDGGTIVIGVADDLTRQGVTDGERATYNPEQMRDQLAAYADPNVQFSVSYPTDRDGRVYIVINVSPFEDVPTICKRDGGDTSAGDIYYRSKNRRIESARVSNSFDMRDILDRAAVKRMQKMQKLGLKIDDVAVAKFDNELGEL